VCWQRDILYESQPIVSLGSLGFEMDDLNIKARLPAVERRSHCRHAGGCGAIVAQRVRRGGAQHCRRGPEWDAGVVSFSPAVEAGRSPRIQSAAVRTTNTVRSCQDDG